MVNEFKSAAQRARARDRAHIRVSEAWTAVIFILVIAKRTKLKIFMSAASFFSAITKIKINAVSSDLSSLSQIAGAARASSRKRARPQT